MTGRPAWLRNSIPELDGLRGLAILPVVLYHCHGKFGWQPIESVVQWGWAGVNLFFVLSGFLITGIIVDGRSDPRFFRNFYGRRALRIWPVYVLLLALFYVLIPLAFGNFWSVIDGVRKAPWLYYVLFTQNLFALSLPGAIGPTWSLAVEEQFYVVWAPVARFLRNSALMGIAAAVLVLCPLLRLANLSWVTPTNTLIHMDGLAVGALVAVGVRTVALSRAVWRGLGLTAIGVGGAGAVYLLWHGSAFSDSMLALLFGGMMLTAIVTSGEKTALNSCLSIPPLRFYGRISYGLYMTHILVFVLMWAFDERMQKFGTVGGLAVVFMRLMLATSAAWAMWNWFEKPILKLKRHFEPEPTLDKELPAAELVPAD